MKVRILTWALIILAGACLSARPAWANCVDYDILDEESPCFGAGGCESSHPWIICAPGCTPGTCVPHGSSGLCCGKIYYLPVIYPDSSNCNGNCQGVVVRVHTAARTDGGKGVPRSTRVSPGLIVINGNLEYKEPVFVYAFDRCAHRYGVVIEGDGRIVKGGM